MIIHVVGSKGAKNTEVLNVLLGGDLAGIVTDVNGFLDFSANNVTRVTVSCQGQTLDSDVFNQTSVVFGTIDLEIEWGDFDLKPGVFDDIEVSMYIGAAIKRIVIAGKGRATEVSLTYVGLSVADPRVYFVPAVDFSDEGAFWSVDKDIDDVEFYPLRVARWLKGSDVSSILYEPPVNSELVVEEYVNEGSVVSAKLSGGLPGTHIIDVTITSDDGRTRQRAIDLIVKAQ